MSSGRLSGSVELRPIRLGLVIAPGSIESLERAIRAASICWAGSTFPIFHGHEEQSSVRRAAVLLGLDALVACDEDPRGLDLASMDGFSWMGYRSPVNFEEYGDRLIDVATVLTGLKGEMRREEAPPLVTWDENDDLALLRAVLYGRIGDASDYERSVRDILSESLPTIQLARNELMSPAASLPVGPLELGMWAVQHRALHCESGIAVIDQSSVGDLTKLWNLRATGNVVLPWSVPHDERVAALTRACLPSLPLTRWGQEGEEYMTVFTATRDIPSELRELLEAEQRGRIHTSFLDLEPHVHLASGIGTQFTNHFEVRIDRDPRGGMTARLPLPRTGMTYDRDLRHGLQYGAARVSIHSERDLGERVSFRAPAVRQLAKELRWAVSVNSPVVRGIGEGIVVGYSINGEHDLTLGSIDSINLICRLLGAAGFQGKMSEAGRWTARIVDMLGGESSTLAAQPAIREVLDLASREGGANPEELHNAARRLGGDWEKRAVLWLRSTPYHRWVVGVLAAQNHRGSPDLYLRCLWPAPTHDTRANPAHSYVQRLRPRNSAEPAGGDRRPLATQDSTPPDPKAPAVGASDRRIAPTSRATPTTRRHREPALLARARLGAQRPEVRDRLRRLSSGRTGISIDHRREQGAQRLRRRRRLQP